MEFPCFTLPWLIQAHPGISRSHLVLIYIFIILKVLCPVTSLIQFPMESLINASVFNLLSQYLSIIKQNVRTHNKCIVVIGLTCKTVGVLESALLYDTARMFLFCFCQCLVNILCCCFGTRSLQMCFITSIRGGWVYIS